MFRELKERISLPTQLHLATRIWKEADLKSEITDIIKQHQSQLTKSFASAKTVIQRMLAIGWLQKIPVLVPEGKPAPTLYLIDMEASPNEIIEPWELLQGYQTDGVICYFGALSLHELTTQQPSFYHIAVPRAPKQGSVVSLKETTATPAKAKEQARDPLGRMAFMYQEIPCYLTRPESSHMAGFQTREYGPRTQVNITTPEQTMLDALWQPLKCGGQAIAFEAWERGVLRWNPDRMAQHLIKINRQDWERRVGAMLSLLGVGAGSEALSQLLETRRQQVALTPDIPPLPLLNHLPASTLLPEWGILLP